MFHVLNTTPPFLDREERIVDSTHEFPDDDGGSSICPVRSDSLTDLSWLTLSSENWFPELTLTDSEESLPQNSAETERVEEEADVKPILDGATVKTEPTEYYSPDPSTSRPSSSPPMVIVSRPPFSYVHLILMAINSSPDKKMTLREMYAWIQHHFPFYKAATQGWKNAIRHSLSCYAAFVRVSSGSNGGHWTFDMSRNVHPTKKSLKPQILSFYQKISRENSNFRSAEPFAAGVSLASLNLRQQRHTHHSHPPYPCVQVNGTCLFDPNDKGDPLHAIAEEIV